MTYRMTMMGAAAAFALVSAPIALATEAAPAGVDVPAAAVFSTAETSIGTLLDNPQAKAVLEKHIPAFVANPQISMARSMTLKQIRSFAADVLTDEVLVRIDADLAALPPSN